MKLNPTLFSLIEQRIGLEKVFYADIKSELADHIACRIESEMKQEKEFEPLLEKALVELNPKKFERSVLIQAHLDAFKDLFSNIGNPKVLAFSIGLTVLIGAYMQIFPNQTSSLFEKNLKSAFLIATYSGFIFGLWKNKFLSNSQILATLNTIFLVASITQFSIRLEWLLWTGLNTQILVFFMTACFSFIICSAYSNLFKKIRIVQWR